MPQLRGNEPILGLNIDLHLVGCLTILAHYFPWHAHCVHDPN
jgi:hypothetical protein